MLICAVLLSMVVIVAGETWHGFNDGERLLFYSVVDYKHECEIVTHEGVPTEKINSALSITGAELDELYGYCREFNEEDGVKTRKKRDFLIYPGTKWCGRGNTAEDDDDLGNHTSLDTCCRDHDLCTPRIDTVRKFRTYWIWLVSPFTWVHCDCDDTFKACLLAVNDEHANFVGNVYFDVLNWIIKCFKDEMRTICVKWKWDWSIWRFICIREETAIGHVAYDTPSYP